MITIGIFNSAYRLRNKGHPESSGPISQQMPGFVRGEGPFPSEIFRTSSAQSEAEDFPHYQWPDRTAD
jgi:cytochrome c556